MTNATRFASLFALFGACALALPALAGQGHDHSDDTATEMNQPDHAHDDDHAGDGHDHESHGEGELPNNAGAEAKAHAFEAAGVRIVHPWMNATDGRDALIYLELENTGDALVSLQGADVPFAESASLVGFVLQNGEGTYQALPFVPVQPGRSLELAPEGLAILASGLTRGFDQGETAQMSLVTSAGAIALTVAVEPNSALQHSHAGHNH